MQWSWTKQEPQSRWIGSDDAELQLLISYKTDGSILLSWFCELFSMWMQLMQQQQQQQFHVFAPELESAKCYAHLGWRVCQPSLDLRSKEGSARPVIHSCFNETLCTSCKLYQIKTKKSSDLLRCLCSLCFFPFDWAVWVNVVHEDTHLRHIWGSCILVNWKIRPLAARGRNS